MSDDARQEDESQDQQPGLFQRYPKLGVLLIAGVAYAILLGMCVTVGILMIRG